MDPWYSKSEAELRELCKDAAFRAGIEARIAELKALPDGRCHMSKALLAKLERVLE